MLIFDERQRIDLRPRDPRREGGDDADEETDIALTQGRGARVVG
jgi:hypothetical protein